MRPGARLTVERRGPRGPGASCLSARGALARITGVDVGDELRQLGGRRRVALPVTSNDGTARHHPPRGRERRAERGGRRARQHWASAIRIDQLQIRLPISSLTQKTWVLSAALQSLPSGNKRQRHALVCRRVPYSVKSQIALTNRKLIGSDCQAPTRCCRCADRSFGPRDTT